MILIDTNVLMYAAGAPHPNKVPSAELIQRVAAGKVAAAINAEVLQEILHRYRAIRRWEDGRKLYSVTRRLFPQVQPVTTVTMDRAAQLLDKYATLSARDAIHVASVLELGASTICSYDKNFDGLSEVRRVEPTQA